MKTMIVQFISTAKHLEVPLVIDKWLSKKKTLDFLRVLALGGAVGVEA